MVMNQIYFLIYNNCGSHAAFVNNFITDPALISKGQNIATSYIPNPSKIVGCQKYEGAISDITEKIIFYPELPGYINVDFIYSDDGVRYIDGVPINVVI
jgi:hypothetical protein